jgi:hypothetical protein
VILKNVRGFPAECIFFISNNHILAEQTHQTGNGWHSDFTFSNGLAVCYYVAWLAGLHVSHASRPMMFEEILLCIDVLIDTL